MYQSYGVNNPITKLLKVHWYGGMYTLSFTNSQNEKSMGVRLGDLDGHGMQPPRPIHLSVNSDNLEWIL
jgi:hypothetical protein